MRKNKNSVVFGCFSPPVMVATFTIEIILAIYTYTRYKLDARGRLILAILVFLAGFQLAEYYVCTQSSIAITSARIGFVSITALPPLGFFLMSQLTRRLSNKTTILISAVTVLVASYFLLAPTAFDSYRCTGNYVIFQIGDLQTYLYSLFYFGLVAISLGKGAKYLSTKPSVKKARPVRWLLAGYAVFIVPVAVVCVFHPDTRDALPSILCGFAVLLALVLAYKVAPMALRERDK